MNLSVIHLFSFLRRYGIPGFLVAFLVMEIVCGFVLDRVPVPEAPYVGYVSHSNRVFFQWRNNGLEPPFVMQLIDDDGVFDQPEIEKTVLGNSIVVPGLVSGTQWRWRVVHQKTNAISGEAHFSTAPYLVRY
jgi:hypothetical protein